MVEPSWAVTTTVMVLLPTARGMTGEAVPLATTVPLTRDGCSWYQLAVGVTVMPVTLLTTAVRITRCRCMRRPGYRAPWLTVRLLRSALLEAAAARVTVMVSVLLWSRPVQ